MTAVRVQWFSSVNITHWLFGLTRHATKPQFWLTECSIFVHNVMSYTHPRPNFDSFSLWSWSFSSCLCEKFCSRTQNWLSQWDLLFSPQHEISNNVVCATSKTSDQPTHTRNLIRTFASCLKILYEFFKSYWSNIISKLKRRPHRLIWVYTCQNATLLEITCRGSNILIFLYLDACTCSQSHKRRGLIC